jgi:hypothetical protein
MIKVARVDVSIVQLDSIRIRLVSRPVKYVLSVTILLQLASPLVCLVHLASLVPAMAPPPVRTVVQAASKANKLLHHVSYVQSVRLVKVVVCLPVSHVVGAPTPIRPDSVNVCRVQWALIRIRMVNRSVSCVVRAATNRHWVSRLVCLVKPALLRC